jgi:hypothetical protein
MSSNQEVSKELLNNSKENFNLPKFSTSSENEENLQSPQSEEETLSEELPGRNRNAHLEYDSYGWHPNE